MKAKATDTTPRIPADPPWFFANSSGQKRASGLEPEG
jgi:hypothetical protein